MMRQHLRSVKTPDSQISDPWFSQQVECYLKEKLSEHSNIEEGTELRNVAVNRADVQLPPKSDLAMTVGLEEEEIEAVFFLSNCCRVASVTADLA